MQRATASCTDAACTESLAAGGVTAGANVAASSRVFESSRLAEDVAALARCVVLLSEPEAGAPAWRRGSLAVGGASTATPWQKP